MRDGRVLVLGDDTRSFLATVRSLGRRGIAVEVAPSNFRSPALRSRYISAVHDLPPWMEDGAEWLESITNLLRRGDFDLVIPCNETTLLPLQYHRAQLAPLVRLAIPDDRAVAVLFDKLATRELAEAAGVPVAKGRLLRADDTGEALLAELGEPVVVKPRHSYSLRQLAARGAVRLVREAGELQRVLAECDAEETVVEQFFRGSGLGISLLASQGEVLQAFEHHRVREIAGASFYRISAPLTPGLARACEAVVAALQYTGLAMFEFKRNEDGAWILLEVNARPWGSMPLPVALGIDFPYRWYRLLTAGEKTPPVDYRIGVYGRNLVPDLRASLVEADALRLSRPAKTWFFLRRAAELLRPVVGREVHDCLVRDDPAPGFTELSQFATSQVQRLSRRLPGAAVRRRRTADASLVRAAAQDAPSILFVCRGNICRSPFAAALLARHLGERGISIASAGVMPQPGRSTPAFGIQAALRHGVDLSAHRSCWLSRQMAESASLVVVFDDIIAGALFDRFPDLQAPVINLGDLVGLAEIADPVDSDCAEFDRVFAQIAGAVEDMAARLRDSRGPAGERPAAAPDGCHISLACIDDLAGVENAWRALEGEAAPTFFQSWTWVGCLAAERFPRPVLLRAEREGRTVGLALLNRRRSVLGRDSLWLSESGTVALDKIYIEHNGVLLARDAGDLLPACVNALLTAPIGQDGVGGWGRRVRLAGVDAAHFAAARREGTVHVLRESAAPYVDLTAIPAGPNGYLATLSANTRYQIRRSNRALARLGPLAVREARTVDEAQAFLDALARLHQAAWAARGLEGAFTRTFVRFHRALVARALPRGEVMLLQIKAGPHVVGYLYNFRHRNRVLSYQSGFDYAGIAALAGRHAKPGLTAHHAAILYARAEGADTYDLLAGPDRYKTSLASKATPLYWLECAPPRAA